MKRKDIVSLSVIVILLFLAGMNYLIYSISDSLDHQNKGPVILATAGVSLFALLGMFISYFAGQSQASTLLRYLEENKNKYSELLATCNTQVDEIASLKRRLSATENQEVALAARCQVEIATVAALTEQLTSSHDEIALLENNIGLLRGEIETLLQRLAYYTKRKDDEEND